MNVFLHSQRRESCPIGRNSHLLCNSHLNNGSAWVPNESYTSLQPLSLDLHGPLVILAFPLPTPPYFPLTYFFFVSFREVFLSVAQQFKTPRAVLLQGNYCLKQYFLEAEKLCPVINACGDGVLSEDELQEPLILPSIVCQARGILTQGSFSFGADAMGKLVFSSSG